MLKPFSAVNFLLQFTNCALLCSLYQQGNVTGIPPYLAVLRLIGIYQNQICAPLKENLKKSCHSFQCYYLYSKTILFFLSFLCSMHIAFSTTLVFGRDIVLQIQTNRTHYICLRSIDYSGTQIFILIKSIFTKPNENSNVLSVSTFT